MRWLESITDSMDMNLSKLQKIAENTGAWHAAVHGVAKADMTQRLNNRKLKNFLIKIKIMLAVTKQKFFTDSYGHLCRTKISTWNPP